MEKHSRPLTDTTTKDVEIDWNQPKKEQALAFKDVKEMMTNLPFFVLPVSDRLYMIDTHASENAIGVVLLQQQNDRSSKPVDKGGILEKRR